jgi:hypothetical protein
VWLLLLLPLLLLLTPPASDSVEDVPSVPESLLPMEGVGAGVPSSDAVALLRFGRALSLGANLVWPLSTIGIEGMRLAAI